MTTWRYALGISLFLMALYVVFVRGFTDYKSEEILTEWEGCYLSREAGALHIADGYLTLSEGGLPKIRISRSEDNQGAFLVLHPSLYFDRRTEGGTYTPRVGASKLKGLRIVQNGEIATIITYSVGGDLIEFVRDQCEQRSTAK